MAYATSNNSIYILIDVIYFHELRHFLLSLYLLSIYLCTRLLWFILEFHTRQNLDYCYSYLSVIKRPDEEMYDVRLKDFEEIPPNGLSFEEATAQFHELINKLTTKSYKY
jgi:hypothetical protein